jgi:release factor glutamine methyltransferase
MDYKNELQQAKRDFLQAGFQEVDAELLLAHVLGISRMDLHNSVKLEASLAQIEDSSIIDDQYSAACARRLTGEPVQYITGEAHFRNLTLKVGKGVLIPRPESELLITHILEHINSQNNPQQKTTSVIDLGAGSGALALAIATEAPNSRVIAVESDPAALLWLRKNVAASEAEVRVVDEDVATALDGVKADLVIANPPYIPNTQELPIEVQNFEPHFALFGGKTGMEMPAIFIAAASRLLKSGGLLVMEHGEDQGDAVARELESDFTGIRVHLDLNNRPRWTSAERLN